MDPPAFRGLCFLVRSYQDKGQPARTMAEEHNNSRYRSSAAVTPRVTGGSCREYLPPVNYIGPCEIDRARTQACVVRLAVNATGGFRVKYVHWTSRQCEPLTATVCVCHKIHYLFLLAHIDCILMSIH